MKRTIGGMALGSLVLVLVYGCTSPNRAPNYEPEPGLTAQTGATLYGARDRDPDITVADPRVMIATIDGRPTGRTVATFDQPLLVSAGTHSVHLWVRQAQRGGAIATQLTVDAGKSYAVRMKRDGRMVNLWFEMQPSGEPVGDKVVLCMDPDMLFLQLVASCRR